MSLLTQISYTALAPVSVVCEAFILYAFLRLKQIKEHPEIMIFWQCLSQIILDVHWFTGIQAINNNLSAVECRFLGAFGVYFYFLSWDYNLLLSIEILLKILNPHHTGYKKRQIWYHSISHLTSAAIFLSIMVSDTNGNSIMKTCFVEARSVYELVVFLPVFIHFPICTCVVLYTIYISYNTFYVSYLKYHMIVVMAFSMSWVPIGIVHGLNYNGFSLTIPVWFVYVIFKQLAVFLGGPSGFFVFLARMMQEGLLKKILTSIFRPHLFTNSLYTQLQAENMCNLNISTYSELFSSVTSKAIIDILIALNNVLISSENTEIRGQDHREWDFPLYKNSDKKFSIIQYNINDYERIMKRYKISYTDLANSLNYADNSIDVELRCTSIGGRSGAFFYFTSDRELILKTITSDESTVLKSMIKEYADRLCSEEGSYLAKIFGVFKIKTNSTQAFRVVIMENLSRNFEDPLKFDLKGSKTDRKAATKEYTSLDVMPRNKVYKDLDFHLTVQNIAIDCFEKTTLIAKITLDTALLEKYSIMDYSLLVLIEQAFFTRDSMIEGHPFTTNGKFLVYVGIIDYLQTYNMGKKLENKYKILKRNKASNLSAISPQPYRKRFIKMVKNIFSDLIVN